MRAVVVAALALLAFASCSYFEGETDPYRPPAAAASPFPDNGRDLYMRDCAWCHGSEGRGTDRAPDLVSGTNGPAFTDFMLSSGRMPIDPGERVARHESIYSRAQIDQIVEFSATLGAPGPHIPEFDLSSADIARGGELYQENCAACHSTTGIGGALTQGKFVDAGGAIAQSAAIVAPPVTDATDVEVAEAIRVGPGTMPVFSEETVDAADLNAIVRYVAYLRDPDDRGGAEIGHVGPVTEGAVAWIVGLGLLLVFVRWVGTRRGEP